MNDITASQALQIAKAISEAEMPLDMDWITCGPAPLPVICITEGHCGYWWVGIDGVQGLWGHGTLEGATYSATGALTAEEAKLYRRDMGYRRPVMTRRLWVNWAGQGRPWWW